MAVKTDSDSEIQYVTNVLNSSPPEPLLAPVEHRQYLNVSWMIIYVLFVSISLAALILSVIGVIQ